MKCNISGFIKLNIFILAVLILMGCSENQKILPVTLSSNVFEVSIGLIKEKTPVFFAFNDNGKIIKFFVVRVNGKVRSYFDVCNSCKTKNLGYRAYETELECRACLIKIPYEELETGIGSCYPFHLKGEEKDGKYVIVKEEILKLNAYL